MRAFGADDVVLKRQVGGGARAQVRYSRGDVAGDLATSIMDRPGMIQPFVPAIASEGEFSFLFIDGEFSHVVLKRPKAGEYRIQEAYGGKAMPVEAASADRAAAQAVLDVLETMPLYARVDMVRGADGGLMLMELEVLEPYLFPEDGPHIGAMLGKALARRLAR
jgi:glutathione synthase/RimK-type ligase-like ATP-grasp enzyme